MPLTNPSFAFFLTSAVLVVGCSTEATSETKSQQPSDPAAPSASGTPSEPSSSGTAGDTSGTTSTMPQALTCASHTLCTSYKVAAYSGQRLPVATGGKPDGLYRLSHQLQKSGTGVDKSGTEVTALLFGGGKFLGMGFGANYLGKAAVNGTKLGFTYESNCDSETGATHEASTRGATETSFSVDPATGNLTLIYEQYGYADVYTHATAACPSLVSAVPATPGESANCSVTNCGCTEGTNKAASHSVCNFVTGHTD